MKLKIIAADRHRNGVAGNPFEVVLFKVHRDFGTKVAVLFDEPGNCAVLDVNLLAAGDIAFGSNSWRGDDFEQRLRKAIADRDLSLASSINLNELARSGRCQDALAALQGLYPGAPDSILVDLLADARHWCDRHGWSFAALDRKAYQRYLGELGELAGRPA